VATRRIDSAGLQLTVVDDGHLLHARGIAYAHAERFGPPAPVRPTDGAMDATERGPACPQLPSRLESVTGPVVNELTASEHCQVLSVTAPVDAQRLPVMVWFHGGAYVSGGGEAAKYDSDLLAAEGRVVVVTVTYRLGVFGYLNLLDDGCDNLGLRDQICALQWVRDHIEAFGGDPRRVTIFGQSAGADAVMALMLCPEATGLFGRAIMHSAPLGLKGSRTALAAAMRDAATAALTGTPPTQASVDQLLVAQTAAARTGQQFGRLGLMPFAPIPGRAPLPAEDEVADRMRDAASRIEILVGYTRHDARPFVELNPMGVRARRLGAIGGVLCAVAARVMTRRVFGGPALALAAAWTAAGGRARTFRVDWSPRGAPLGACHCIELPLLFGPAARWADAPMLGPAPGTLGDGLGRTVRTHWSAFARDGIAALDGISLRIG
jgi:para-nitrobenzyl esterase